MDLMTIHAEKDVLCVQISSVAVNVIHSSISLYGVEQTLDVLLGRRAQLTQTLLKFTNQILISEQANSIVPPTNIEILLVIARIVTLLVLLVSVDLLSVLPVQMTMKFW
jgi:hypothetical protein